MPNNKISRESLIKTIEARYKSNQPAGGAFDAKKVKTTPGIVQTDADSINVKLYRQGGFEVKKTKTGYKGIKGDKYNSNSSLLSRGLNNTRYK